VPAPVEPDAGWRGVLAGQAKDGNRRGRRQRRGVAESDEGHSPGWVMATGEIGELAVGDSSYLPLGLELSGVVAGSGKRASEGREILREAAVNYIHADSGGKVIGASA
jgi:hypothetical protein